MRRHNTRPATRSLIVERNKCAGKMFTGTTYCCTSLKKKAFSSVAYRSSSKPYTWAYTSICACVRRPRKCFPFKMCDRYGGRARPFERRGHERPIKGFSTMLFHLSCVNDCKDFSVLHFAFPPSLANPRASNNARGPQPPTPYPKSPDLRMLLQLEPYRLSHI